MSLNAPEKLIELSTRHLSQETLGRCRRELAQQFPIVFFPLGPHLFINLEDGGVLGAFDNERRDDLARVVNEADRRGAKWLYLSPDVYVIDEDLPDLNVYEHEE